MAQRQGSDDGHPPMLSVRNGAEAVEFYKAAFGAAEWFRLDDRDGAVAARLSVEGAEFGSPMTLRT